MQWSLLATPTPLTKQLNTVEREHTLIIPLKHVKDRITNEEDFQEVKEEMLLLKMVNNRQCYSWIGHIIRCNEFVVNILQGAILGEKRPWKDLD
jgi:hypothetical protein